MVSRRKKAAVFILILLLAWSAGLKACMAVNMQSETDRVEFKYEEPAKQGSPSVAGMILEMILALVIIVALAWAILGFLGRRMTGRMQGRWIRVLDEVVLGPNRGIMAVELGGKVFLMGVTDHQISLLMEIEDPGLVHEMLAIREEHYGYPWEGTSYWAKVFKNALLRPRDRQGRFSHVMDDKLKAMERLSKRLRPEEDHPGDGGWFK